MAITELQITETFKILYGFKIYFLANNKLITLKFRVPHKINSVKLPYLFCLIQVQIRTDHCTILHQKRRVFEPNKFYHRELKRHNVLKQFCF